MGVADNASATLAKVQTGISCPQGIDLDDKQVKSQRSNVSPPKHFLQPFPAILSVKNQKVRRQISGQ
jgi:hypothetical protein